MPRRPLRESLAALPARLPGTARELPGRTRRLVQPRGRTPRLGFATVRGRSMEPTLHEGDRLLVAWDLPPRAGRMALVQLPDGPDGARPLSVKRVSGPDPQDPGSWWVERDNPREGVDSWQAGGVPDADVRARVLTRVPDVGSMLRSPVFLAVAGWGLSRRTSLRRRRG